MVRKSAKKTGNPKATAHSEPSTPHDDPLSTPHANTQSDQDPAGVTRQLFSLTPQVTAEELLNMREEGKLWRKQPLGTDEDSPISEQYCRSTDLIHGLSANRNDFITRCCTAMRRLEVALPSPLTKHSGSLKSKSSPIQQTFDSSVTGVTTGMLHRELKTSRLSLANNKYGPSSALWEHTASKSWKEKSSKVVAEVNFIKRKQIPGESFDKYWFTLKDMADEAELCNRCRDAQIVRQIVVGIRDNDTKVALEEESTFPTQDRAIAICRAKESANRSSSKISNTQIQHVQTRSRSFGRSKISTNRSSSSNTDGSKQSCRNCGKIHSPSKQVCPANGQNCNSCNKKGHFASMCRSSKVSSVYVTNIDKQSSESRSNKFCDLRSITAHFFSLNGISLGSLKNVLPDSGASANFISTQNAERLGFNVNTGRKPEGQLTAANNLSINIIGEMKVKIKYHDIMTPITFQVSNEYQGTLLSLDTSIALKIIHPEFPVPIVSVRNVQMSRPVFEVLHVNGDSFESTPATTTSHHSEAPVHKNQNIPEAGEESIFATKESLLREYSDVFDGEKNISRSWMDLPWSSTSSPTQLLSKLEVPDLSLYLFVSGSKRCSMI
ncbi:unnamed protein product [Lepeophtheirus salmonis]|uniref:(salmon louse) hypothetical protein n=1 Tax=Lepeophtheirus salmonis TaxID=72036 RepID=A0A817FAI6_LEPSM|nr:unnamed protein product [Lepeophtheirus salmonis]CAG9475742.1 unnamed protein product [Lepeophtheirus salmonis]